MNKKELSEIRKNFSESSGFFTLDRVLTAYVDPEKNVLYKENKNYALIPEDEGTVSVAGYAADHVRTSVQDGRKCLVIDLDDPNVTVNDIDVRF